MYKISNGQSTFEVKMEKTGTSGTVNGEGFEVDIVKQSRQAWHLLHNDKSYTIHIAKANFDTKEFSISVNGQIYELKAQDEFDLLLDEMGMSNMTTQKLNNLKAPMPGLVLDVMVEVGQQVEKGTPLLILEAMKMENVLKSPDSATVKKILIEKGQAVEKNHVLLTFE